MLARVRAALRALRGAGSDPGRFELRAPSAQTAVDIFQGRWASDLGQLLPGVQAGRHPLFIEPRPRLAAERLGQGGRLDGLSVLELGPLEGAHSWQLEQLGAAEVVGVEANADAYLKCLVIKEVLGLGRTRFLHGDFAEFLRGTDRRFDLIFASGVLYHMADPLALIALIAAHTDRCFVWTHHYLAERCPGRRAERAEVGGFAAEYYRRAYGAKGGQFWGGNRETASWMTRDAILSAFAHFGLGDIVVIEDTPAHENGPAFAFAARRPRAS